MKKINMHDILMQNTATSDQMDTVSFSTGSHAGIWLNEQLFCKLLSEGDPGYKEAIQKSFSLSHGMKTDIGDALRYHKNNFIVLLTLCSRACIQGGLSPDIAYDLNDYYAEKIEQCKSMSDTNKLSNEMLDFLLRQPTASLTMTSKLHFFKRCPSFFILFATKSAADASLSSGSRQ